MNTAITAAAKAIRSAGSLVAVTGAGISAESGIPTFRGTSGLWVKYPPEEYATLDGYIANPAKVWAFWCELAVELCGCKPNPGHYALAELEAMGLLRAVITQNIDHLHQDAGSRRVIEYHGNARTLRCLDCGASKPLDIARMGTLPPRCVLCGGLMKPDVVMFGELIPRGALAEAEDLASQCDALLIVGTSAQVYPAAAIPYTSKARGAFIVESNIEPTDFTRTVSDIFVEGPAGKTLPAIVSRIRAG